MIKLARRPRVEFPGAFYHIIQRGHNREEIFKKAEEKNVFIGALWVVAQKFDCLIIGYVVMDNHYHLLLQMVSDPVSRFLQQLNGRYAQYYNRENNRQGYVYESRYKAHLILNDKYLLAVLRYIHQNPVRAQLVERAADYRWSSDSCYRSRKPGIVHTDYILNMLSADRNAAIAKYCSLVDTPVGPKEKNKLFRDLDRHYQDALAQIKSQEQQSAASLSHSQGCDLQPEWGGRSAGSNELDALLRHLCSSDKEYALIKSGSRAKSLKPIKKAFVMKAREAGYTWQDIGESISLSISGVWSLYNN